MSPIEKFMRESKMQSIESFFGGISLKRCNLSTIPKKGAKTKPSEGGLKFRCSRYCVGAEIR